MVRLPYHWQLAHRDIGTVFRLPANSLTEAEQIARHLLARDSWTLTDDMAVAVGTAPPANWLSMDVPSITV